MKLSLFLCGCLITLIALVGCSNDQQVSKEPNKLVETPVEPVATVETANNPEDAYHVVFQKLFSQVDEQNKGSFAVVDLSKMKLANKKALTDRLESFCNSNHLALKIGTLDQLKSDGYFTPGKNIGLSFLFNDLELTDTMLKTSASCNGSQATYTVEFKDGNWQITNESDFAIFD